MRFWVVVAAVALLHACSVRPDPAAQAEIFCATLDQVNQGNVDTADMRELEGHAATLRALLDAAPAAISDELEQFHNVFARWSAAVTGDNSMLMTFTVLSDPSLAGAQGRIGDYIATHCGVDLGDGEYVEAERPTSQHICPAWPRIGSPLTFNNFPNLPDISGANYFANNFIMNRLGVELGDAFAVEPGGWVEFRGQYPRARYFAYHPNDFDLNNLPTLRDQDLNPDPGSVNPFRAVPVPGSENYYTARLVFSAAPAQPQPNTRYVGVKKDGVSTNRYLFNMLRLYASDIGDGPNSGGVPLPAMTIYTATGEVSEHFEECDLYAPGNEVLKTDLKFPTLPIADHRPRRQPVWSASSNFEAPSDTLANADVQYLATTYSQRFGELFVVRARRLSTPNTRAGDPASSAGHDLRLFTLCNYNIWAGHAIDCMLDHELETDDEGFYTLVISRAEDKPGNLLQQQATWMDWGPFLDGQLSYRYVYRESPKVAAIVAALAGQVIAATDQDYVPQASPCTRQLFEQGGWRACL